MAPSAGAVVLVRGARPIELMASLATFVRERSRPSAWVEAGRRLCVVLGNEAADTDSIVGSVCLAYLRQRQSAPAVRWVAPWIQCSRRELSLRSETSALLRRAGVDPAWLVCRDELDLTHLRAGDVRFVLVDHNALAGRILDAAPWAADAVEEIIDHHLDTGAHPGVVGNRRDIDFDATLNRGAGSCCSLIGDQYLTQHAELLAPSRRDGSCTALALLGVILLDTGALSEAVGKATDRDHRVATQLLTHCPRGTDPAALHQQLADCKFDPAFWLSLPIQDALALDYKEVSLAPTGAVTPAIARAAPRSITIGFSSVLVGAIDFVTRAVQPSPEPPPRALIEDRTPSDDDTNADSTDSAAAGDDDGAGDGADPDIEEGLPNAIAPQPQVDRIEGVLEDMQLFCRGRHIDALVVMTLRQDADGGNTASEGAAAAAAVAHVEVTRPSAEAPSVERDLIVFVPRTSAIEDDDDGDDGDHSASPSRDHADGADAILLTSSEVPYGLPLSPTAADSPDPSTVTRAHNTTVPTHPHESANVPSDMDPLHSASHPPHLAVTVPRVASLPESASLSSLGRAGAAAASSSSCEWSHRSSPRGRHLLALLTSSLGAHDLLLQPGLTNSADKGTSPPPPSSSSSASSASGAAHRGSEAPVLPTRPSQPDDLRRLAASHAASSHTAASSSPFSIASPPVPTPMAGGVISEDLQLQPLRLRTAEGSASEVLIASPHGWLVAFRQGNTRASRKQVKPRMERMIAAFLAD